MHVSKAFGYWLFIALFVVEVFFVALNFDKIASMQVWQLLLVGVAAFRGGRAISYNEVFAWLREPFCTVEPDSSGAGMSVVPRSDRGPFWQAIGDCLACPICTSTHIGSLLLSMIALWQPFGLTMVYALAIAGIAEGIHWWTEQQEWHGRWAREQAGTEWLSKTRTQPQMHRLHRSNEVGNTSIRGKVNYPIRHQTIDEE